MRLKTYLKEASFGKKVAIERTAYMKDYPEMLKWVLYPYSNDDKVNYKTIEDIAWKEAKSLKNKDIIAFHDDDFDTSMVQGHGDRTYESNLKLRSYEPDKLNKELKRLKFKIKG